MNDDLINITNKLQECTKDNNAQQVIGELAIAIERLGFAQVNGTHISTGKEGEAALGFLLGDSVSAGMLAFCQYLQAMGKIDLLIKDGGRNFLGYCKSQYAAKREFTFKSAINLSLEKQRDVSVSLLRIFPVNSRIIFRSDPALIAGFVIYEGTNEICNYSLRKQGVQLLETFVRRKLVKQ